MLNCIVKKETFCMIGMSCKLCIFGRLTLHLYIQIWDRKKQNYNNLNIYTIAVTTCNFCFAASKFILSYMQKNKIPPTKNYKSCHSLLPFKCRTVTTNRFCIKLDITNADKRARIIISFISPSSSTFLLSFFKSLIKTI